MKMKISHVLIVNQREALKAAALPWDNHMINKNMMKTN